jgi:hypothetical protein
VQTSPRVSLKVWNLLYNFKFVEDCLINMSIERVAGARVVCELVTSQNCNTKNVQEKPSRTTTVEEDFDIDSKFKFRMPKKEEQIQMI